MISLLKTNMIVLERELKKSGLTYRCIETELLFLTKNKIQMHVTQIVNKYRETISALDTESEQKAKQAIEACIIIEPLHIDGCGNS